MNKSNARDYLPLVQALSDGKTLQMEDASGCWRDIPADLSIYLDNSADRYRIKPYPIERWIALLGDGECSTEHFLTKETCERHYSHYSNFVKIIKLVEEI